MFCGCLAININDGIETVDCGCACVDEAWREFTFFASFIISVKFAATYDYVGVVVRILRINEDERATTVHAVGVNPCAIVVRKVAALNVVRFVRYEKVVCCANFSCVADVQTLLFASDSVWLVECPFYLCE